MTSTPGSFARQTIVERKPQILREVSQAYPYPPDIQAALAAFAVEIGAQPIRPLTEDAPDRELWNTALAPFAGRTWLEVPWYLAETLFYRRLMEIVRFYQPGPWRDVDPFAPQKAAGLEHALPAFLPILQQSYPDPERLYSASAFTGMMHDALWGNLADLSNRTVTARADEGRLSTDAGLGRQADRRREDSLLIDDTPQIWRYLVHGPLVRVDLIADNSGLELLLDLRLVDFLLSAGLTRQVRIHLKRMPFFVSDAMVRDLHHTLHRCGAADSRGESPSPGQEFAARLRRAMEAGQLVLRDDPFWSTCLSYRGGRVRPAPEPMVRELAGSDLVLLKGDVNYRRLLDDRQWPYTAHMADIAAGFPAPFVALRTLKGELIVDLQPGQAEALAASDPTWLINGQRGLVQFVNQKGRHAQDPGAGRIR
jgi:uncharacterized protein with ATP-grasp and redox domains